MAKIYKVPCEKCGNQNPEGATDCDNCGASLIGVQPIPIDVALGDDMAGNVPYRLYYVDLATHQIDESKFIDIVGDNESAGPIGRSHDKYVPMYDVTPWLQYATDPQGQKYAAASRNHGTISFKLPNKTISITRLVSADPAKSAPLIHVWPQGLQVNERKLQSGETYELQHGDRFVVGNIHGSTLEPQNPPGILIEVVMNPKAVSKFAVIS